MVEDMMIYPRPRRSWQEFKEFAANSCYSVILIGLALILLRPVMVRHMLSRAEAYSSVGQIDESRRECDKALLIGSESDYAWCQLGRFYKATGDRERAYAAYQKAVQVDPKNKPAQFELGMMYIDDGSYAAAIPCFEKVRELGPEKAMDLQVGTPPYHRDALNMLASCYEKTGDPTKLELVLEEMGVFYPGFGNIEQRLMQLKTSTSAGK